MAVGDRELERHGEAFLQAFEAIRRALALYPGNHPKVIEQLERFSANLAEMRALSGTVVVNVSRGEFIVNGLPLKRLSLSYGRAIASWEESGIGLVRFDPAMTPGSLLRFFEALSHDPAEVALRGGMSAYLAELGVAGIAVSSIVAEISAEQELEVLPAADLEVAPTDPVEARARFQDSIGGFEMLVDKAREGTAGAPRLIRALSQQLEERIVERRPVRQLLDQLRAHHEESHRHATAGAMIAVAIGSALGLERSRLTVLAEAAVLRDIGKLDVAAEALVARDHDAAQREEYRSHSIRGARRLLATREIDPSAAIVALEHHAQHDGQGFPPLRARKGLHPFSRIIAVASDYDRLSGGYRGGPGLDPAHAMRKLAQRAGSVHDPMAVRALMRVVGFVPEGTGVRLRDGRRGVATGIGSRVLLAPEVILLNDAAGTAVEPRIVDTHDLAAPGEPIVDRTWVAGGDEARGVERFRRRAVPPPVIARLPPVAPRS